MRGITPVIAIILLLLITISIVGFALVFFQRTTETASQAGEEQLKQQVTQASSLPRIEGASGDRVYIRNVGNSNLDKSTLAFYVDGEQKTITSATVNPLPPGEFGEYQLSGFSADAATVVKVTSAGLEDKWLDKPKSCKGILASGKSTGNGVYAIQPAGSTQFNVYCDTTNDGGGWTLVMKSLSDNSDFYYDSMHWTTSSLLNENDFSLANNANSKYASFNAVPVNEMLIDMNGIKKTFTLLPSLKGKTMLELTSGYSLNHGDSTGETAEEIRGSYPNPSYWGLLADGHETYICHNLGFAYDYWGGCNGAARIGFSLSQEYPCGHPGTSEGLGLREDCQPDNLGSGRLHWSGETNHWAKAFVYVR